MAFWRREPAEPTVPRDVRGRLDFVRGERLLASSLDESGTWVVVTTAALYAVPPHGEVLARPWHLVDSGSWDHDEFTLTVTWVDGARPQQFVFRESMQVLVAFRERVQASVVLSETLAFGPNRSARVVIRKDLADGSLHDQTLLGRGVRLENPGVRDALDIARGRLREQVGL